MRYFFNAVLLLTTLFANEKEFFLTSDKINFDGKKLHLSENILLEHSLGNIISKRASYEKISNKIFFEDEVKIDFKNSAKITSEKAILDLTNKQIFFSSEKDKIQFNSTLNNNTIYLKSHKVMGIYESDIAKDFKSISSLKELTFFNDVEIRYNDFFYFKGEEAKYIKAKNEEHIYLYPKKECFFKYNNDEIKSKICHIDMTNKNISLEKASGFFYLEKYGKFQFTSESIFFDSLAKEMNLSGNVNLIHEYLGTIKASEVFKTPQKIKARGKTDFFFSDQKSKILCNGNIIIDNEKRIINAYATKDNDQIYFQDEKVNILSNRANVSYDEKKNEMQIKSINLEGDIRFVSKNLTKSLSFAVADIIDYDIETERVILKSMPGKKVYFWQEDNSLSICAKEVEITEKKQVKGKGNVRFSFDFEEDKFLHEIFSKYLNKL